MDLALNNLQRLICHKTQQTKPNQTKHISWKLCASINYLYIFYILTYHWILILGISQSLPHLLSWIKATSCEILFFVVDERGRDSLRFLFFARTIPDQYLLLVTCFPYTVTNSGWISIVMGMHKSYYLWYLYVYSLFYSGSHLYSVVT